MATPVILHAALSLTAAALLGACGGHAMRQGAAELLLPPPDNLLAGSEEWSPARPNHFRVEADFVTCTQ